MDGIANNSRAIDPKPIGLRSIYTHGLRGKKRKATAMHKLGQWVRRSAIWLWCRWGQIVCFGSGGLIALGATQRYTDLAIIGWALTGGVLLFTGLGLRALLIWRDKP